MTETQENPAAGPSGTTAMARAIAREVIALLRAEQAAGDDLILGTPEAAEMLGVSSKTLENWRSIGTGPKFLKIGTRQVGYRIGDLRDWVSARPARGRRSLLSIGEK